MIGFKRENLNPKGRKTTDCVIRAITAATKKDYNEVLMDLAKLQVETAYDMSDKRCYEKYLVSLGWIKHKQPRKIDGTKYRVGEINKLVYPGQRAIISMAGHLSVKVDQDIIDTWDCRRKTIGYYYTHPEDNID